jgi:adenylate cyclase
MQGYLCSEPGRTVRVRIKNDQGFITVKGMGNHSGMSRFEWEKEIPVNEAFQLLELCEEGVIEKIRYEVPEKSGLTFEVDEFHGALEGLVLAEIELPSEDYPFVKPAWLGKEVTGDKRYYNSALAKKAVRSNKKSD